MMTFFHTGITVSDIGGAKQFFSEVLGMKVTSERDLSGDYLARMLGKEPGLTARIVMLQADQNSFIELVEYSRGTPSGTNEVTKADISVPNACHFAFFVEDLASFHERWAGSHISPLAESSDVIPAGPLAESLIRFYHSSFGCLLEVIQRAH